MRTPGTGAALPSLPQRDETQRIAAVVQIEQRPPQAVGYQRGHDDDGCAVGQVQRLAAQRILDGPAAVGDDARQRLQDQRELVAVAGRADAQDRARRAA